MTDYAEGKAAWLAEGLPAVGRIDDGQRLGAVANPPTVADELRFLEPGEVPTVRPSVTAREAVDRLRRQGDDAPPVLYVTTARARLLGTVDTAELLARARTDDLP